MVIKENKIKEIQEKMKELGILEKDLEEKFILASKKGGQKVQKTSSCVYIKQIPTQIEVKCQKERLRETNRFLARRELCNQYEEKILHKKTKRQTELSKMKKQKKRRQRRATDSNE